MVKDLFQKKQILKLLEYYQSIWALDHLNKLATWDGEVYMPTKGAMYRGKALAKSQTLIQQLFLSKEFTNLIASSEKEDLNDYEKAVIRVLKKELDMFQKLPPKFIEEFEETVSEAQIVWRKARETDDFDLFQPMLEKIVDLSRQKAKYLGYKNNPYDALLDTYEEGLTVKFLDDYFNKVTTTVTELLSYLKNNPKYTNDNLMSSLEYDVEKAKNLNHELLSFLQYDSQKLRLDVSSHPFSEGLSTHDSRITTRYEGFDIARTVTSTIHEFGHALYFLQHNEEINTTPLYTNYSLALHESQSRFFENHIGRSKTFFVENLSKFHDLGTKYEQYSADDFYKHFNQVKPSLIRVEADEVTYHAHIYIRYKIEEALINDRLKVQDIPVTWNEMYRDILGIIPKNDSEGCLQDIHWSMGAIGYFPTYSLGTVFASQISNKLESELSSISELVTTSVGMRKLQEWLAKNIHQYGATYTFEQISKRITGSELDTKYWSNYLNDKYRKIYS
jgi:carboxypeptidase Taq